MGEESVKGANMGVILIIFAAILALGLIIFMLARSMANEGLTNVTEKLESASMAEFTDFDQHIVVGQRIIAALNGFKGKKVTVLVATQGLTDKVSQTFAQDTPIPASLMTGKATGSNPILGSTAVVSGHEGMIFAFGARPARNGDGSINNDASLRVQLPASSSGRTNDKQLTFIQYNSMLEPTSNTGIVTTGTGNSVIWWSDDHYVFSGGFRSDDGGKTMFDMIWTNVSKTGTTEVIPPSARFNANLLKDENGVILGVVFQQIGS